MTLEPDVHALLEQECREKGVSMKDAVNHLIRVGLSQSFQDTVQLFQVVPRKLGLPPGMNYDNVEELVERISTPMHR